MMSGHYKPWSAEMDAELTALWNANRTQVEIAAALQRSKGSVYERAKVLKLSRRSLSNVNKKMGFWTPEKDAALTAHFEAGWSFSQISAEIGAASRNACIGRSHRLGLRRNEAANLKNRQRSTAKATQASAQAAAVRRANIAATPRPRVRMQAGNQVFVEAMEREPRETIRSRAWVPLEGSNPVSFTDPTFNRAFHCSWPIGDALEIRCAQPIAKGAYCACHADIAYTPPKARNSAKELIRSLRRYAA